MKQRVFLCKHCQHELTLPRAGMRLQELRVVERVPEPVIPAYTQAPLWTGESAGPST